LEKVSLDCAWRRYEKVAYSEVENMKKGVVSRYPWAHSAASASAHSLNRRMETVCGEEVVVCDGEIDTGSGASI
jgi:hypothetical protein